jgi:phosphatidate cytidylyltransferase
VGTPAGGDVPNDAEEDRGGHPVGTKDAQLRADVSADEEAPRRTGEVRVDAVEAAVAAGLVEAAPESETAPLTADDTATVPLPDWTDPPSGQVPRVLLDEGEDPDAPRLKGPSWRQRAQDWEEDAAALEYLVEQGEDDLDEMATIAGRETPGVADGDPFEFDFEPPTLHPRAEWDSTGPHAVTVASEGETVDAAPDDQAWSGLIAVPPRHRRHSRSGAHRARQVSASSGRRNPGVAIATGVVLAGVAVGCFESGPVAVLVLAAVALSLAAGETFGALRRAGFRPLSLLGLVATAAVVVFAYLKGPIADPVVLAGLVVLAGSTLVVAPLGRSAVEDLGVTVLVVTWVGVLGSFAALLVNPSIFPHRHGVAYLGAVVGLTVAHDIGSYVVGSRFGRHRFVPRVSPGKTVEGLLGGSALALVVAGLLVARVHPLTVASSLGLGALVVVLAPLGDLVQSLVKRDLGLKDMGRLLPAHGGISDRIDAMLFVLPAAFIFFRLVHLG